jgi:V8-like Glu-specific endopeptidase
MRSSVLSASALALAVLACAAHGAGTSGITVGGYSPPETVAKGVLRDRMAELHATLTADAAPLPKQGGYSVQLDDAERSAIGEVQSVGVRAIERQVQVGVGKPLNVSIDLSNAAGRGHAAGGALRATSDGGFAWTTAVSSPGAHALRVMFDGLDLPDGAALYVFNDRGEAFGPYTGRGMDGSGELVSNTVTGDRVNVQLRASGAIDPRDRQQLRFRIAEIGHIGPKFALPRRVNPDLVTPKAFCSYNVSCVVNGECVSGFDQVRDAVAHMLYRSGGSYYICTGGLVNNSANDQRDLFLTANHCISTERSADSLETFFDFRAASCQDTAVCDATYTQMRSDFPTTLGADLLAADSAGDFSLMELNQKPAGTRHYLGFTTTPVASSDATALYRISHPSGAPQAFSAQRVDADSFTCTTLPRGRFIYSQDTQGATEGGSSGSPVVTAGGLVVGQLYGACGTNLNDECDADSNRTVDGALAYYYPNVAPYLDPQGGGGDTVAHVASIVLSVAPSGRNKFVGTATVTVVDAAGAPVPNATVSGQFTFGNRKQNGSGVTSSSGVAALQSGAQNSQSFGFCVTGITGNGIAYDAGANAETCDSR